MEEENSFFVKLRLYNDKDKSTDQTKARFINLIERLSNPKIYHTLKNSNSKETLINCREYLLEFLKNCVDNHDIEIYGTPEYKEKIEGLEKMKAIELKSFKRVIKILVKIIGFEIRDEKEFEELLEDLPIYQHLIHMGAYKTLEIKKTILEIISKNMISDEKNDHLAFAVIYCELGEMRQIRKKRKGQESAFNAILRFLEEKDVNMENEIYRKEKDMTDFVKKELTNRELIRKLCMNSKEIDNKKSISEYLRETIDEEDLALFDKIDIDKFN